MLETLNPLPSREKETPEETIKRLRARVDRLQERVGSLRGALMSVIARMPAGDQDFLDEMRALAKGKER
jgi:hypothetical protein